jgi:hypothetical protein
MRSAILTTPKPPSSIASSPPRTVKMASSRLRFVSCTPTTYASLTYAKLVRNYGCYIHILLCAATMKPTAAATNARVAANAAFLHAGSHSAGRCHHHRAVSLLPPGRECTILLFSSRGRASGSWDAVLPSRSERSGKVRVVPAAHPGVLSPPAHRPRSSCNRGWSRR